MGNADYPKGGSGYLANIARDKYLEKNGTIKYNQEIKICLHQSQRVLHNSINLFYLELTRIYAINIQLQYNQEL